jgi:hypothetical protein
VTVRDLRAGRDYGFHGPDFCQFDDGQFGDLAIAGDAVAWWASYHADDAYQWLGIARVGGKQRDDIVDTELTDCTDGGLGDLITGLAAGAASVLYSYVDMEGEGNNQDFSCAPYKKRGGVFVSSSRRRISGLPPATALAASGDRIAVAPVDPDPGHGFAVPVINGTVEVYDARTRHRVATATVTGAARSVALTDSLLTVLAHTARGFELERFNPRSGASLGETPVPAAISTRISGSGNAVVYSAGRQIWRLDGSTGRHTLLISAASRPVGLSVQRNRVVWGENVGGAGRILALRLS